MYAQPMNRPDIPSNYSGNAFRYPPIGSLKEEVVAQETADRSPLREESVYRTGGEVGEVLSISDREEQTRRPSPLSGLLGGGRGFGNEELLLIGLSLLVSGGGSHSFQSSDVLPYLLLLLVLG